MAELKKSRAAIHLAVTFDQGSGVVEAVPLAEHEYDLGAFSRLELHLRLQSGTRVQARSGFSREFPTPFQRCGMFEAGVPAQELEAVAGP